MSNCLMAKKDWNFMVGGKLMERSSRMGFGPAFVACCNGWVMRAIKGRITTIYGMNIPESVKRRYQREVDEEEEEE